MADNVYNLKFTLSNGDVLDAGQIVAPQGQKGDKGDKGDPGTGVNVDTLLSLLTGSNGILVTLDSSGNKALIKIDEEFTSPGFIMHTSNGKSTTIRPTQIAVEANDATYQEYIEINGKKINHYEITSFSQGQPVVADSVYLHEGNVKTINGQSIYGTGDITAGGSKSYKHYLELDFVSNTTTDAATIYMTDINKSSTEFDSITGILYECFPTQESPTYPTIYHEATGYYNSTPIVAIKYTASKIYAVTTTGEKDITPNVGMWIVSDYVVDVSTNIKPVTA